MAQPRPQFQVSRGDVALACLEAEQLVVDGGSPLIKLPLRDGRPGDLAISVRDSVPRDNVGRRDLLPPDREMLRGRHRVEACPDKEFPVLLRSDQAGIPGPLRFADLPFQFREPVAAMPRARDVQGGQLLP